MDFACASGQNVLLVGPPGSGKTSMINDFFDTQDPQAQVSAATLLLKIVSMKLMQNRCTLFMAKCSTYIFGQICVCCITLF